MNRFLTPVLMLTFLFCIDGHSLSDANKLYQELRSKQNRYIRGKMNQNEATEVRAHFYILSLNEVDELSGKVSITGFFEIRWRDDRMTWDYHKYGNAYSMKFPQSEVWKPLIVLANAYNHIKPLGSDFLPVQFLFNGSAMWLPGDLFEFRCSLDITNFPYDTQTCYMELLPWTSSVLEVVFNLTSSLSANQFVENGVWDVVDVNVKSIVKGYTEVIFVNIKLTRRSGFYLINVILPIFLMGILNIFVFLLPPESGDRITYSITVLLSIAIFQTILSENLPKTSYPEVPVLSVKLLADFICSCVITIFCIIGLRIYSADSEQPVPKLLRKVTCFLICCKYNGRKFRRLCRIKENQVQSLRKQQKSQSSEGDSERGKETSQNLEHEANWREVGLAMDFIFTLCSILLLGISNVAYMVYIQTNMEETVNRIEFKDLQYDIFTV